MKTDRAKRHLQELKGIIDAFLATDPYRVEAKRRDSGELVYFVAAIQPTPEDVPLVAGDVIQTLRSALDQLAYELFRKNSGPRPDARHVYFPIGRDAKAYLADRRKKTHGISASAVALIDSLKPYRGGADVLWKLHSLNNIDKHRMLVTVGSHFQSLDLGAYMQAAMRRRRPEMQFPDISAFIGASSEEYPAEPVTIGEELFVDGKDAEFVSNMGFKFSVALMEPGIVNAEPVTLLLQQMVDEVEKLLPLFEKEL